MTSRLTDNSERNKLLLYLHKYGCTPNTFLKYIGFEKLLIFAHSYDTLEPREGSQQIGRKHANELKKQIELLGISEEYTGSTKVYKSGRCDLLASAFSTGAFTEDYVRYDKKLCAVQDCLNRCREHSAKYYNAESIYTRLFMFCEYLHRLYNALSRPHTNMLTGKPMRELSLERF